MDVDYIIVGLGLAGLAFAEELENNDKSFVIFENGSQNFVAIDNLSKSILQSGDV